MEKEENKKISVYDLVKSYNAKAEGDTKQKQGLTYAPWAVILEELFKIDPQFDWGVVDDPQTGFSYWRDCSVRVWIRVFDTTREMRLPVMGAGNKAIPYDSITSTDWNKAMMRCLVKCAAAKFGLGLSVFRGEEFTEYERDVESDIIIEKINNCKTVDELLKVYNEHVPTITRSSSLVGLFTARKAYLLTIKPEKANAKH